MIFTITDNFSLTESQKERNLYYKLFAGYLFNEMVDGSEKRKAGFFQLLKDILDIPERFRGNKEAVAGIIDAISMQPVSVTFDYHSSQLMKAHKKEDRGEMSDILLLSDTHFVSIECKFLEDMKFGKDIEEVQKRMKAVSQELGLVPIQMLLMKQSKWDESKNLGKHEGSFYTKFQTKEIDLPVIVLFWHELDSLIKDDRVKLYLSKQIERRKSRD